ncbi:hypothetical protein NP493_1160g00027 [Ridgeia piscesae]|uniref:Chitin-binding type-2 domain-containing protein n=1 Tax=Ridgeia piscesae TaxID=27915 RepID=A0AAD9KF47_RIDPI|nr:hypothetical protein NP493_1160g00027 [Ridgeia piscesae]
MKFTVALMVLVVAVAAQGCRDSCDGHGNEMFPSRCPGPVQRYCRCHGGRLSYHYCSDNHQCLIKDRCGACQDTCRGKRDGDYPSLDNPRPFYYHCENGFLSYRTCHPNEVFNAWNRKCMCYEVFCEKGDGYQPSVCGANDCGDYVLCEGGFAVKPRNCPRRHPYFCCRRRRCVSDSSVCGRCHRHR